jgi:hypothetical protein
MATKHQPANRSLIAIAAALLLSIAPLGAAAQVDPTAVQQRYADYTVDQAASEGFVLDPFCLDATSFDQPADLGAMGFHATDQRRTMGPIQADRPQAIIFDGDGNVVGVEYEVMADMVATPPQLFGHTFTRMGAHPGMDHEHYALHLWIVDNPAGEFADFNPGLACPPGSLPDEVPVDMPMPMDMPMEMPNR